MTINAPHMTPFERDLYESNHEENYRGFIIKPKRDFGRHGYWSSEYRTNLNAGWVVVYGAGVFRGALATPGATFAWTLAETYLMIDDMITAGYRPECNSCDEGNSDFFWKLVRARNSDKSEEKNESY
jgi:hypothetical protein